MKTFGKAGSAGLTCVFAFVMTNLGIIAGGTSPAANAASVCPTFYNYAYFSQALLPPHTNYYNGPSGQCPIIGQTDGNYRNVRLQCKVTNPETGAVWFKGYQQASGLNGWVRKADMVASTVPASSPLC